MKYKIALLLGLTGLTPTQCDSKKNIPSLFFTAQVNEKKVYICSITRPSTTTIQKHGEEYFAAAAFLLPHVLEKAHTENCPFILIIPEKLDGYTPIASESPLIEGARVALTWASAYQRFEKLGNVDVRVVLLPQADENSTHDITEYISKVTAYPLQKQTNLSPEQNMATRILRTGEFVALKSILLIKIEPYYPLIPLEKQTIITPALTDTPQKKRAVITGAAGFIGSHLSKELIKRGYQVIGLDNLSCCTGENINPLKGNKNFSFHQLDVSYPFDINGPVDAVIHLASVPSPVQYYAMPVETLRSGLHGTKETLELTHRKNAQFLFASTSEVYGDPKEHPQTEQYPGNVSAIGKRSQYDESKRGAETLIKLYFDQYGMDVRIARIFNTFGPGMQLSDGRVITNFVNAALTNTPMIVHGNGMQTRSPAYVSDTVAGIIGILESEKIGTFTSIEQRVFNVGNQEEYSINEIAEFVNQIAQTHLNKTVPTNHIPHFDSTDPQVRQPDITHLSATTQFKIQVPFKDGLERTFLHYYKESRKK